MRRSTSALLGGSFAGAVVGALGFVVRPRRQHSCHTPQADHTPELVRLDPNLPDLLRAHLDVDGDGLVPRTDTVELCLHGRMRVGPGLSLPVVMRTDRACEDFASHIAITWWGGRVVNGLDAHVGGHGLTKIGPRAEVGLEIDQGANLFGWSEALMLPALFAEGTPVKAVQTGDEQITLTVPFGHGTDEAQLSFDDGVPVRFFALRHRGVGRAREGWHVDYEQWHDVHGLPVPERVTVTWSDDGSPWLRLSLDSVVPGVDAGAALAEAGAAVHEARAAAGLHG